MPLFALLLAAAAVPPTPPALTTAAAAAAVVRRYYALLGAHDYRAAYRLWEGDGAASGKSYAAFRQGFAHTATTAVVTGPPGALDGAAGSSFVDVPATVTARLTGGVRQRFAGSYTLRRANDIDGSSAEQRRWHLHAAHLHAAKPHG